jgi:hypothetical protein
LGQTVTTGYPILFSVEHLAGCKTHDLDFTLGKLPSDTNAETATSAGGVVNLLKARQLRSGEVRTCLQERRTFTNDTLAITETLVTEGIFASACIRR